MQAQGITAYEPKDQAERRENKEEKRSQDESRYQPADGEGDHHPANKDRA